MAFLPFAATVGGWMTGAAAGTSSLAAGAAAATMGGAAIAGTAGAVGSAVLSASQAGKMPKIPDLPQSPTATGAALTARDIMKQRRASMSRSESIFTSPLGIGGQAEVNKKTLLGQ